MENYLDTVKNLYKQVAVNPDKGLCCTTTPIWQLPELSIPKKMLDMNYGCGSTVNPRDLINNPKILYVGVGGGMELLQFSYFNRNENAVIGIDPVEEMLAVCKENLNDAEEENKWFKSEFINLKLGDALRLPVEDESIDVAAQNCLFNIFHNNSQLWIKLSKKVKKTFLSFEIIILYNQTNSSDLSFIKYLFASNVK